MEDDREPDPSAGRRKINRRDIKVQTIVRTRDAVGRRPAAFMASVATIVWILVAEA